VRIILNSKIDNSDLPQIDPLRTLVNDYSLGVYGMLSSADAAFNAGALTFAGEYNSEGAVLTQDSTSVITFPVAEVEEMTILVCWDLHTRTDMNQVALGNLSPSSAPYSGFRHVRYTTGVQYTQIATGATSPSLTLQSVGSFGAWTAQALQITNSVFRRITHAGDVTETALSARVMSDLGYFYANGSPDSLATPAGGGQEGTMGLVAFYNKIFTTDEVVSMLDSVAEVMAARGVTIP